MAYPTRVIQVQLAKREVRTIDAQTRQLTCTAGVVWITQDRDLRDVVLEPGDHFSPVPGRHTIAYALADASLSLCIDAPAPVHSAARPRSPAARGLVLE